MLYAQIGATDAKLQSLEQGHMDQEFQDLAKKKTTSRKLGFTVAVSGRRRLRAAGVGAAAGHGGVRPAANSGRLGGGEGKRRRGRAP